MADADDPRSHASRLRAQLDDVLRHAREDVAKVADPKAQALFETAAEVLSGLSTAFAHYERHAERTWR